MARSTGIPRITHRLQPSYEDQLQAVLRPVRSAMHSTAEVTLHRRTLRDYRLPISSNM